MEPVTAATLRCAERNLKRAERHLKVLQRDLDRLTLPYRRRRYELDKAVSATWGEECADRAVGRMRTTLQEAQMRVNEMRKAYARLAASRARSLARARGTALLLEGC